jgi:hypothetical protein
MHDASRRIKLGGDLRPDDGAIYADILIPDA